jgi:YD repeat-containing protein
MDYGYDRARRLLNVTVDGVLAAAYTYDQNGNRLSRTTSSGMESANYDGQDRLTNYGQLSYTYTYTYTVIMPRAQHRGSSGDAGRVRGRTSESLC